MARPKATETENKQQVTAADIAAQVITNSRARNMETKTTMSTEVALYKDDIEWIDQHIMPGFITWVQTIDPALFLSFMSLWTVSPSSQNTAIPIVQTFLGPDRENTIASIKTVNEVAGSNQYSTNLELIKTSASSSVPNVLTAYREVVEKHILPAVEKTTSQDKGTQVFIFQVRSLDASLMYFLTDLQEIYYKYWGNNLQTKFKILPSGFPKIIFVPMVELSFPTYFRRKAIFVNFDNYSPKSAFCKNYRQASLLLTGAQERLAKIPFPLTLMEQTASFSPSSPDISHLIKNSLIESTPGLSVIDNNVSENQIAGFEKIKKWIAQTKVFMNSTHYKDSERPRGVLLVGMPGTGKTTFCKVVSSLFGWPLINMDISQMKAGIQGQTEYNMQSAIQTLTTIGKCILQIDEVEKALGGTVSSNATDGGTLMGILNKLLQFMESDDHSIIVIMTANSVADIPPPLMRSGRIDLSVYAELPKLQTRKDIFAIHLSKAEFIKLPEDELTELAKITEGYSGAEIESAVYHAKWALVAENKFDKMTSDAAYKALVAETKEIKPVSKSRHKDLTEIVQWAESFAISTES
jgi:SpoVK/Ycf46/Vps4 family AAA+-type ATPase